MSSKAYRMFYRIRFESVLALRPGLTSLRVTMRRMRSSSLVPKPAIASCNRRAKNRGLYLATSTIKQGAHMQIKYQETYKKRDISNKKNIAKWVGENIVS